MLDSPVFFIWISIKLALSGLVLGMNATHALNIRAWWINLLRIPGLIMFLWLIWSPDTWMHNAAGLNYGAGMVGAMILNGILNLLVFALRDEIDDGRGQFRGAEFTIPLPPEAEENLRSKPQPDPYSEGFRIIDGKEDAK